MSRRLSEMKSCKRCGRKRVARSDRSNYCVECQHQGLRPIANWMEFGACRNESYDPEWWWPERGDADHGDTPIALRICRTCPVRDLCLDYAIHHDEREGVWGGLMPSARRALAMSRRVRQAV